MNTISAIATKIREVVGMTTQEFGIKKMQKALDWVLRWGWSTPGLVDALGGTSRGHCAKLVAKKLLIATPTASGAIAGFPAKTVTVTKLGMTMIGDVEIVESLKSKKPRIVPQNLRHDVLVQKIVLCMLRNQRGQNMTGIGLFCGDDEYQHVNGKFLPFYFSYGDGELSLEYQTPREIYARKLPGKQPDAQIIEVIDGFEGCYNQKTWHIELEISEKRGAKLHIFVKSICEMLSTNDSESVALFFVDQNVLQRYKNAFEQDDIPSYARNSRGLFETTNNPFKIPKNVVRDSIDFVFVEQTGSNRATSKPTI